MIFRSFLGHTSGLNIGIVKVEFFHCSEWFDPICQRCCKGRATSWSIRIWNDGLIQELKIQILKIRNNVEHGFLRLQVTSCVLIWVVVINYGKIKNDIGAMSSSVEGRKRNRTALLFGLMAAPNLGLLASFDTRRSPELHLVRCAICSLYAAADTALKRWPTALRHPLLPTLHCLPVLCQVRLRAPPPPRPCHQGTSFVSPFPLRRRPLTTRLPKKDASQPASGASVSFCETANRLAPVLYLKALVTSPLGIGLQKMFDEATAWRWQRWQAATQRFRGSGLTLPHDGIEAPF